MKLFLIEISENGIWSPHSVWLRSDFRVVLKLLGDKDEAYRNKLRIRRVTREDAEKIPANVLDKSSIDFDTVEWVTI